MTHINASRQLKVSVQGSGNTVSAGRMTNEIYIHVEHRKCLVGINVHCQNKLWNTKKKSLESNIWRTSFGSGPPFTYNTFMHDYYSRNSSRSFLMLHNSQGIFTYPSYTVLPPTMQLIYFLLLATCFSRVWPSSGVSSLKLFHCMVCPISPSTWMWYLLT
jgi:hypothetical protein